jgi:hypothetical protein
MPLHICTPFQERKEKQFQTINLMKKLLNKSIY